MKGKLTAMSYKIKVRNCHLLLYATIQLWLPQMETTQTKKKSKMKQQTTAYRKLVSNQKDFKGIRQDW